MTTNNNRPKVELQLNELATLKLLKDKAFTGENQHGPYFMYNVDDQGVEKVLFATAEVHQAILENGLKMGDTFSIKKVAVQNGKKIGTDVQFAIVSKLTRPTNGNGHANGEFHYRETMQECLRDSVAATQAVNTVTWTTENITSIALTMFIQRAKAH